MSQEKSTEELQMDLLVYKNLRRRNEDIAYWRKRAGWFDDDVSMKEFNNGVYDTYYQLDDDGHSSSGNKSGSKNKSSGGATGLAVVGGTKGLGTFLKIGAAVVAVGFAILLFRALSRRSSSSRKKESSSSKHSSADTKTRSHSRSRSSRSRSRTRRTTSSNYELMDEKSESRSRKSSRSRSRSRRHSKTRKSSRSRSKGRQTKKEVLV